MIENILWRIQNTYVVTLTLKGRKMFFVGNSKKVASIEVIIHKIIKMRTQEKQLNTSSWISLIGYSNEVLS